MNKEALELIRALLANLQCEHSEAMGEDHFFRITHGLKDAGCSVCQLESKTLKFLQEQAVNGACMCGCR